MPCPVWFVLPRICTNDPNTTALSDVNCLFSIIEDLGIQEATFNALFDCITSMIGRYFYLHIVKSMPCNQACKSLGFLIFILTFTWEWLSSWLCDQNIFHEFWLIYHKESSHSSIGPMVCEKTMF